MYSFLSITSPFFWLVYSQQLHCLLVHIDKFLFPGFSVPFMWIFKLYGGCLPFVDDDMVDVAVLVSSAVYAYATSQYISGYIESPSKRMFGFKLRRRVCEFWLFGSVCAIVWAAAQRFGIVS